MNGSLERQFLTLTLDKERFAISVGNVLEVLENARVTRLPCSLPYMKGLIDLRGKGIPVIDLRLRFGLPEAAPTKDTAIVVVEHEREGERFVAGLLADAVHEVIELEAGRIEAAPDIGAGPAADYLRGIAKRDDGFILVLDVNRILEGSDLPGQEALEVGAKDGPA